MRIRMSVLASLVGALLLATGLGAAPAFPARAAGQIDVPLEVQNGLSITRQDEPVTTGVPLPLSAGVTSVADLNIVDASYDPVPSQFSVTARWGGAPDDPSRPIKWVLVTFLADVGPSTAATYRLTSGTPNTSSSDLRVAVDDASRVVVDTGAAVFEVSRLRGSFLERVEVGGTTVTDSDENGVVMQEQGWPEAASCDVPPGAVTVVEQGPVRIGIKVEGDLGSTVPSQSDYETIMYFYPGKTYTRVLHSQVNHDTLKFGDGAWRVYDYYEPGSLTFTSLKIEHSLHEPAGAINYYAPFSSGNAAGEADGFSVLQDSSGTDYWDTYNGTPYSVGGEDFPDGDHPRPNSYQGFRGYRASNGGSQADAGDQYPGWLDVSDNSKGITMGVDDFWQNFPKGFSAGSGGDASIDIWPLDPNYHDGYNLRVGDKKTHSLFLYFHDGSGQAADADEVAETLLDPLWALAPSQWFSLSGAVTEFTSPGESLEDRLGQYHAGLLDDRQAYDYYNDRTIKEDASAPWWSTHPCMSMVEGDGHPASRDYFNMYGWSFYGNEPLEEESYGDGKCAFFDHKYDFDFGAWLQYIRTRDTRWRELAESMSRHQEMLMLHDTELENGWDPVEYRNVVFGHSMHCERGCDNGVRNHNSQCPEFSWGARGSSLAYYLTGYRPSGEFSEKLCGYIYDIWDFNGMRPGLYEGGDYGESGGVRTPATTLNVLVEGWKLTGDMRYQQRAQEVMDLYAPEDQFYVNGPVPGSGSRNIPVGFFAHYLCAMARYEQVAEEYGLEAESQTARQRLQAFVDFMLEHCSFTYQGMFSSYYRWNTDGSSQPDGSQVNNWCLVCADACAYVYGFTGDITYLDSARDYFSTGVNSPYCYDTRGKLFYTSTKEATNHAVHGGAYMYYAAQAEGAPAVLSVTPNRAVTGTTVPVTDLAGMNFREGASVLLAKSGQPDIRADDVVVVSDASITCTLDLTGAAAGAWDIVVGNEDGGRGILPGGFTVEAEELPAPTVTSMIPDRGASGTTVNVTDLAGTDFLEGAAVRLRKSGQADIGATDVNVASGTKITCTLDLTGAATGSWDVSVTNPDGRGATLPGGFTVEAVPVPAKPSITSISPTSGRAGTIVTITGRDFAKTRGSSYVEFGNTRVSAYVSWSDTRIKVRVPAGAGSGPVTVSTANGNSNGVYFKVTRSSPNSTWYLAEGSTDWGFTTYIVIQNPNETPVTARMTYMTRSGPVEVGDLVLPALSQTILNPANQIGSTDMSTRVECLEGKSIAVDRRMIWTGEGARSQEGHSSMGVTSPSRAWYLAEGSSDWGFETWILVQNPNDSDAGVTLTYMVEGEGPSSFEKAVPANSRVSFSMGKDVGPRDASIGVTSDLPVIAERAMYRNSRREGHDSVGVTSPSTDYYLAEGTTGFGFTTFVLVQNPNETEASVSLTYMTPAGAKELGTFTMPAQSRRTIRSNDHLAGLDCSIRVHADVPIVAERAMYWDSGSGEACHDSVGTDSPRTAFYLPDGETADGYETWVLVQNPNDEEVGVEISYLTPTGEGNITFSDTLPACSRRTYSMADRLPEGRAATIVRCTTQDRGIVAERAMYWNARGAGTDTIGGYSD
ncbi:MAG: IPT/TIG domain-containing protein [Actinobacteria bacterium]|nr:IPT/TIG domain-containing protein [Actinomycetota bacterium]MBU1945140.1 IPT/TIG domain-containing protein [Actinomycetota bacterium]MBU2686410.1 IPT/TIG domain-containing protein [Actinomycetota bacterium]